MTTMSNRELPTAAKKRKVAQWAKCLLDLRDELKALELKYERARKPLLEWKNQLDGKVFGFFEETGGDHFETTEGIRLRIRPGRPTAVVKDKEAFMEYVIRYAE